MVQINWTFRAKSDLKSIYRFISTDSEFYAQKVILDLENKTNILKEHILIGQVVREFHRKDIREIKLYKYRIIYRILDENTIDILAVAHSTRDINKLNIL